MAYVMMKRIISIATMTVETVVGTTSTQNTALSVIAMRWKFAQTKFIPQLAMVSAMMTLTLLNVVMMEETVVALVSTQITVPNVNV